jgi:hypothetical protein
VTYNCKLRVTKGFQPRHSRRGKRRTHYAGGRSSSALILSSTNANREKFTSSNRSIAASKEPSQAFVPHYPHTERTTETKPSRIAMSAKPNTTTRSWRSYYFRATNFVNFVGFQRG